MGKQVTSRNSNFELLRIISILIITVHHISMDCGIESTNMYVRLWAQFFYIGGKLGVNCFILISGYFLYKKEWKPKRIIHTEFTVLFYTILLFIIFAAFGQDITITNVLKTFIPTIFQHYWFITAYIGILLLSPILNFLINESNQKQHLVFIFVLLVIFSVIPTFTAQTVYNSDIGWFGCLYLIGSYIDKYKDSVIVRFLSKKWMFPFFTALIWLASVVFTILEFWIPAFREGTNFFTGMYILPQLLNSISLFLLFKNWSGGARVSELINAVSKHVIVCYLIQSNCFVCIYRSNVWNYLFSCVSYFAYPLFVCGMCIIVFGVGIGIDSLKTRLINLDKLENRLSEMILSYLQKALCVLERLEFKTHNIGEEKRN